MRGPPPLRVSLRLLLRRCRLLDDRNIGRFGGVKDRAMRKRESSFELLQRLGPSLDEPEAAVRLAEKILRIRDRSGRVRTFKANRAQREFEEHRGQHNVVLKARQMGITTWVAGRFFLRTLLHPGCTSLLVAHNREAAEGIFGMVRRMWEYLPEDMREGEWRLQRANAGEIVFAETGSEFRVASAADANAGRGLSVQNLHCSEVSRWPGDAAATLAGLQAALAPDGEMVLESTPNGAYGVFYDIWRSAVPCSGPMGKSRDGSGALGPVLVSHFLPWWLEPAYVGPAVAMEEMTGEELALVREHALTEVQIGFRRGLERSYGALRSQEFAEGAETCFRATGSCCFEVEAIERRLSEIAEPVASRRNGALLQWLPPVPGRSYLIAVDTAGGGAEGDFAAVQVLDLRTGMQCAELQERIRPAELAALCVELAREYAGATVAVERNNHGAAVLALLEQWPELRQYRQGGQMGWLTSAASKPEMVARLGTLLLQTPERFLSRRLLRECRTFVADERGRAGAVRGAHDDLVMAMAIAHAVRAEMLQSA